MLPSFEGLSAQGCGDDRVARFKSNANQVVEVRSGKPRHPCKQGVPSIFTLWAADDMEFFLPDCLASTSGGTSLLVP